ncbi:MAG: heavy-metal-associated domain-containing protein [Sulfurospirillaceae bacterium]|nr:heavy-metal-associated domain-containing protein [Sulfurospirillaceae bacterium]
MKKTFEVLNIKCGGCANTVKSKLKSRFPDIEVDLDFEPRKVSATINSDDDEKYLLQTLRSLGYPFVGDDLGGVESVLLKGKSFVSCAIGKISNKKESKQ